MRILVSNSPSPSLKTTAERLAERAVCEAEHRSIGISHTGFGWTGWRCPQCWFMYFEEWEPWALDMVSGQETPEK